jgi:Fur family transcriptional regulator, stress-responsive regulator
VSYDYPDLQHRLRAAGLRVTAPRLAVLATIQEMGGHIDAEGVSRVTRERLGALSTQAVYDILRAFEAAGLVRRIQPAGTASLYETRTGDNHHHIVCRQCGIVQDVDCVVGERPCLEASNTQGFVVDEAEVTFWGTCPQCQIKSKSGFDEEEVR